MADTTADIPDTPQEVFKLLPAKARLIVFSAAALAGLALTAITTGLAAVQAPAPQWLTIALAVFPVITSGLGILAGSNIQKPTTMTSTAVTVPAVSVDTTPLLADAPTASTESESRPAVAAVTEPAQATTAADVAAAYAATLTTAPEATPTA